MEICPGSGMIKETLSVLLIVSYTSNASLSFQSRVGRIPVSETYQTTYAQRQRLRRNSLPIEDFRRKHPTNPKSSVLFKFNLESGRSGRKASFGSDFRGLQANPCFKIKGVVQKTVQKSVLKNSRFFRKFLKKMELFKNLQIWLFSSIFWVISMVESAKSI